MKPRDFSPMRGTAARADLLRLLAIAPRQLLVLDEAGDQYFAYWERLTTAAPIVANTSIVQDSNVTVTVLTAGYKQSLQMPFVHVIAERQLLEQVKSPQTKDQLPMMVQPISEEDAIPLSKQGRQVNYEDLVPKARLLPALKRHLAHDRFGGLDVSLLVKQIAEQQLPRRLPHRRLNTWHPQWVVVLDFSKRLWPYRQDMHRLAERLLHQCGESGISLRIINHGPLNHWTDWVEEQRSRGLLPTKHAWRMPGADTPVLLVSDLGLLEGTGSETHQAWQCFVRHLITAQTRPWALLPLGAAQLDNGLPKQLTLLRWSPDSRFHPERAYGSGNQLPPGLDDLLAMAAVTRRVDPPLLRVMRLLNPIAPLNAGLEGAFWCNIDVEAGGAANIRREAQAKHLAYFSKQLEYRHLELEQLRNRHHAHLRAVLNHEETLLWGAHALVLDDESKQRLDKAKTFMCKLAATLTQRDAVHKAGVWWKVAQDIVQRADNVMGEHYKSVLAPLVRAIIDVRGDFQQVPDCIVPSDLRKQDDESFPFWLVRDPKTTSILLQPEPPQANQSTLAEPFLLNRGGLRIEKNGLCNFLSMPNQSYCLCSLQEETEIKLISSGEVLTLTSIKRPRGAAAWECGTDGLTVRSATLCNLSHEWSSQPIPIESSLKTSIKTVRMGNGQFQMIEKELTRRRPFVPKEFDDGNITWNYADKSYSGVTFSLDEFGVRADLYFRTAHHSEVFQSFRWIEPGTFWMGSPDDEPERNDDEGPQHEVTISSGFWLADTTCTQALWQAVMNDNPSHFKDDPQQPVETVSWHDVQKFLHKLEKFLPGCQTDLPSEAEWEYACRAGSNTPFSFGRQIIPQQVNYDGKHPYASGELGEYRAKTVLVKSLPANHWGLYEMHGNVLEWCKDEARSYDELPKVDPLGWVADGNERPRTVRGGSWRDNARWARSPFRGAASPGNTSDRLGFRFCLRPTQSGQENVSSTGSPNLASADAVQKSAESSESSLISELGSSFKSVPKPKRRS